MTQTKSVKSGRVYVNSRGALNKRLTKLTNRLENALDRLEVEARGRDRIDSVNFKSYDRRTDAFIKLFVQSEALSAYVKLLEDSLKDIKTISSELDRFVWNDINKVGPRKK